MSNIEEQIASRVNALAKQRKLVLESQSEMREAKESLTRKRKVFEEETEKLGRIVDEIVSLQGGQSMLPFSDHPDLTERGTPAIDAVGTMLAKAEQAKKKSLNANLSILIGYGATDAMVASVMDSDLGVSTVRQLCKAMDADPKWYSHCKGLGPKKRETLAEALQKFLDDSTVKKAAAKSDESDNRLKKCTAENCGAFRDQDVERCPKCNDTVFVLENPPSDAEGESTFGIDYVAIHQVPMEDESTTVLIHTVQHPDTALWHSSYSIATKDNGDTVSAGRTIPHHDSQQFENEEQAIQSACVSAGNKLLQMELDSAAASVREFAQSRSMSEVVNHEHHESEEEEHVDIEAGDPVAV